VSVASYIREMRPRQWVKEAFIFAPLVFALRFLDGAAVARTAAMTGAFILAAGGVYVINDLADRERDRRHPQKRLRPIASGEIPVYAAWLFATLLLAGALVSGFVLGIGSLIVLIAYIAMNVLYSFGLKRRPLLDVMIVAAGFLIRVIAGGVVIGVEVSRWMLLSTFFLALFIAFGKRRSEMTAFSREEWSHSVLRKYNIDVVDPLIYISASLTIITYSLYTVLGTGGNRAGSYLFVTIPFVVYGIFRYLQLIHQQNSEDDPAELLLHDRPIKVCVVLWAIVVLACLTLEYFEIAL
jgi:4-hydroxybenzoate polyprenyltransferase